MNRFFNNKKLLFMVIGLVFLGALAVISTVTQGKDPVTVGINEGLSWGSRIVAKPVEWLEQFNESIARLLNTYEENKMLKEKIDKTYTLQAANEELTIENSQLKAALQLKDNLSDYTMIAATVIGRTPDMWQEQIILNAGEDKGVSENMVVMANGGVIGRISSVTPTSSKLTLLTSKQTNNIKLSAMIQIEGNTVYGVLDRYDEKTKQFIMTNINLDATVQEGQRVVTSGLGGIAPSALMIGTVEKIEVDTTGLFKEVRIKPTGELQDTRYVSIIKRESESK